VVGQVEQFAVVAAVAGDDHLPDRDGAGVELEDARRKHARGHELHLTVDQRDDLAGGDVGIDLRAEVYFDDADAQHRARLDVLQVIAARQGPFQHGGDALLHVLGGHPAVRGEHHDHGHLDLR
jgi:hypothetical protein